MSGRTLSGAGIRISALERKPRKRLDPPRISRSPILRARSRELSLKARYHLTHRMMISWSKCRPLNRSCVEVGSVIPAVIAGYRAFQQFAPEPSIPKGNANPCRKVWEKLMQWDEFIGNENRVGRCGQTLLAMRKRTRPMRIRTIRRFITMKTLLILLIGFRIYLHGKGYGYRRSDNNGLAGKGAVLRQKLQSIRTISVGRSFF